MFSPLQKQIKIKGQTMKSNRRIMWIKSNESLDKVTKYHSFLLLGGSPGFTALDLEDAIKGVFSFQFVFNGFSVEDLCVDFHSNDLTELNDTYSVEVDFRSLCVTSRVYDISISQFRNEVEFPNSTLDEALSTVIGLCHNKFKTGWRLVSYKSLCRMSNEVYDRTI